MKEKQANIQAEQQLLDMLKRIESIRASCSALLVRISELNAQNRSESQVKIATKTLNDILVQHQVNFFVLSNDDIVVIGKKIPTFVWEKAKQAVRTIFKSDSFVRSKPNAFAKSLSLSTDFQALVGYAQERKKIVGAKKGHVQEVPLAPAYLDAILRNIQNFKILKVIRRQEAIEIKPTGEISSLFLKYFTSMMDLKKAIAPDVDVLSNRWLFQHLSETLDVRMLGIFRNLFTHTPKNISLNLNISTIFTPEFEEFLGQMPDRMSLIVEVQFMDIIQNTENYFIAKKLLHDTGHEILIDGVHPISFEFMDIGLLDPDYIKLTWTPKLNNKEESAKIEEHIRRVDPQKIILMRSEDETSLLWAFKHNITKFQGFFIDKLATAKNHRTCPHKKFCTRGDCGTRRAGISKLIRSSCLAPERLDRPTELKKR